MCSHAHAKRVNVWMNVLKVGPSRDMWVDHQFHTFHLFAFSWFKMFYCFYLMFPTNISQYGIFSYVDFSRCYKKEKTCLCVTFPQSAIQQPKNVLQMYLHIYWAWRWTSIFFFEKLQEVQDLMDGLQMLRVQLKEQDKCMFWIDGVVMWD